MKQYKQTKKSGLSFNTDNNKLVNAKLFGVQDNLQIAMTKILDNNSKYFMLDYPVKLKDEFVAHASTNTDYDNFDYQTGEDLAHTRVMEKYHKDFDRKFCELLKDIRCVETAMKHYAEKNGIDISKIPEVSQLENDRYSYTEIFEG